MKAVDDLKKFLLKKDGRDEACFVAITILTNALVAPQIGVGTSSENIGPLLTR